MAPAALEPAGPAPVVGAPARPPRRTPLWKRAARLAFVALALGGLVWLLDHIGWQQIGDFVVRLGWQGVALLLALGFLEAVFDAAAFRAAVPERVGLFAVLTCNQAGSLLNRFIPWEAGELLKGTLLSRHVSGTAAVSGTVVWNYVFRLSKPVAVLGVALFGWMAGPPQQAWLAGWMVLAAVAAFLPYVGLRILFWLGVTGRIVRILQRLKVLRRDPERTLQRARALDEAVRRFWRERPAAYGQVVVYQILARLVSWSSFYAVLRLIDRSYDLATSGVLWAAISVMSYVVALFPTRLGTTEVGSAGVFKLAGLDPGLGLTAQLILTVRAIVTSAVLGAFAMAGAGRRAGTAPDRDRVEGP